MADFRKWFMVIAVVLLAAASASAQSQITTIPCTTSAQVPLMRDGAITDYIGEVDLACDATQVTGVASVTVQFVLAVNSTVTNAVDSSMTAMAGVAVQQAVKPQAIWHTVQGIVWQTNGNTNNALRFPHVVLPMGTTFIVRFFNVRVSSLALSGLWNGTQVFALVAANTENPTGYTVGFTNQPAEGILVGVVQPTMKFALTDCNGKAATANISFQQCVDYPLNSDEDDIGSLAAPVYGVTFTEQYQTFFKNLVEEDGATIGPGTLVPNGPKICDTDHGGVGDKSVMGDVPPIPSCSTGAWVSNGTRLLAQFAVPDALVGKVHIWVSRYQTASTTGAMASLATRTSALGWGLDSISTDGRIRSCTAKGGASGNRWVELPDAATETAAWEMTSDDLAVMDDITFAWAITYQESQLPSLPIGSSYAPITLSGTMAPITDGGDPVPVPISSKPVVRFNLKPIPASVQVTIDHCVTNLLFPYVTNVVGFETGIAIANTSLDNVNFASPKKTPVPFPTTPQAGPCNLYLFGSASAVSMANDDVKNPAGAVMAIASATTASVPAGEVFADTLTTIFNLNGGKTPVTLSGYVIARCDFQFGHGYAYLVNPSGAPQGYMALVIPDREVLNAETGTGVLNVEALRIAQPFSNTIFDEQGEQLGQ